MFYVFQNCVCMCRVQRITFGFNGLWSGNNEIYLNNMFFLALHYTLHYFILFILFSCYSFYVDIVNA